MDSKTSDAQAPYMKQHKTMHTHPPALNLRWKILFSIHGWLNLQMRNLVIQRADYIFTEKYLHISGPVKFKPMLFKCQLQKY